MKSKPAKKTTNKPQEKSHESVKKTKNDWDAIEKEYCLGQKTIRTIGHIYGVSHVAIVRKAKKEGWVQDKTKEIRAKTNAGLAGYQEGVTKKVTTLTRDDIEKAVQTNIQVITSHRKDIQKSQSLIALLQNQLEEAAKNRPDLEDMVIDETKDEAGKVNVQRRSMLLKAISLPAHAGVLRDLSTAQKNLIGLERQAYNLNDVPPGDEVEKVQVEFV